MMSTRLRIAAFFTILGFGVLALFSSSVLYSFHRSWIADEHHELASTLDAFDRKLAGEIDGTEDDEEEQGNDQEEDDFELPKEAKDFFEINEHVEGRIVDQQGKVLFVTAHFPAFEDGKGAYFFSKNHDFLISQKAFSPIKGKIAVAQPIAEYLKQERLFLRISLMLMALSSIVLFLVGYLFAWNILAPLRRIASEMQTISLNNLSRRLPITGHKKDEIRILSENLNAMFERIEKSAETLRRFTQDASHELRTPLAVLDTGLQLALRTGKIEKIRDIREELKKMQKLIDSLLLLAKHEDKKFSAAVKSDFFLRKEIEEILKKITPHFTEKKLSIEIKIPEHTKLFVEHESFVRVLWNLVWNAFKFSPPTGKIIISFQNKAFRIENEGELSTQDIPHLFERFFRGDRSKATDGTGLGLAIAKSLLEANSAKVSVESAAGKIVFVIKIEAVG